MTQEDLSDRTGGALSRSAVANIENGRQRIALHHLYHLALALDLEPVELLPSTSELPSDRILANRRIVGDESAEEFTRLILRDALPADGEEDS